MLKPHNMDPTQMTAVLTRLVTVLYNGSPIPPGEGGRLFREICDERRRAGDLFWTERHIHDLARRLGYWPWTVTQIAAAFADNVREDAVMPPSCLDLDEEAMLQIEQAA